MRRRRPRPIALVLAVLAAAALPAPAGAQVTASLTFTAGPTGGNWTPLAAATAEVVRKRFPEVDLQVEPGTGQANIEKILADRSVSVDGMKRLTPHSTWWHRLPHRQNAL